MQCQHLLIDYFNCDNTCKFVFKIATVQEYYILSVYWAFSFCIGVKIFVLAIGPSCTLFTAIVCLERQLE